MPRRNPPAPIATSRGAIQISSPIASPAQARLQDTPARNGSPRTPTSQRGRGAGGLDGLGLGMRDDDYSLTASPTHDYLEQFDSYPSSPDPTHTPIPQSPSNLSFNSPNEKSGLTNDGFAFGDNQFPSRGHLSPNPSTYSKRPNTRSERATRATAMKMAGTHKQPRGCVPTNPTKRRWLFFGVPIGLVIVAAIAVGAVVGISKSNQSKSTSTAASGSNSTETGSTPDKGQTTGEAALNNTVTGLKGSGRDGSEVTTDLGVKFTYTNSLGGGWAQDPMNPYSVSGQAQSWSPTLMQEWQWGTNIVRGVNLGGWLVTEPFIVPGLYEQYQKTTPKAQDEYTLSQAMGKNLATKMEEHYATFITEQDFAEIAAAGLNWVRIPIGYWAIETTSDEPYLAKVSWTYFVKAIGWARKYGIRIMLDFHALPGSQNGWNHSGKGGSVNWMYGVMGLANAQRHLEQIRSLTEFISQPGIKEVVPMIGLVNEVQTEIVGVETLRQFYYQAYELIRNVTGFGAGNGPIIALHEGFIGVAEWQTFLQGADRLAMDQHPYLAFGEPNNNSWEVNARVACGWGGGTNDSQTNFGITVGGEWSNAINNCGKWLTGVDSTPSYVTSGMGTCDSWEDWQNWNETFRAGIKGYNMANMDALQNFFFWTWKIGNSTEVGYATSPMWHYRLGWQQGWIPADPREAGGYCGSVLQVGGNQFAGTFPASATGGVATPTIAAEQLASHTVWPPTSMGPAFRAADISLFPTLTQTGTPLTMPTGIYATGAQNVGNGWANEDDKVGAWVKVDGCFYPDEYAATASSLLPTARCTGKAAKRGLRWEREAAPTSAPRA